MESPFNSRFSKTGPKGNFQNNNDASKSCFSVENESDANVKHCIPVTHKARTTKVNSLSSKNCVFNTYLVMSSISTDGSGG